MTRKTFEIGLFTSVILFAGCATFSPFKIMVDNRSAIKLLPCPSDAIENPVEHSMFAIQSTIAEADWVIEKVESVNHVVGGRACLKPRNSQSPDFLKRNDVGCASVSFKVESDGTIQMMIPKEKEVNLFLSRDFDSWMIYLERVYSEVRCYNDETLNRLASSSKIEQ